MQSNSQKEEDTSEHSASPPQKKRKKMNHNSSSLTNHQKMEINSGQAIRKEVNSFEKDEIVRLMLQTLHSWGYSKTIETLEKESGVLEQSRAASELCDALIKGDWGLVEKSVPSLHLSSRKEKLVNFHIYRQKFLEMLETKKLQEAIEALRQIGSLGLNEEEVQKLSTLILCLTPEELYTRAEWDGVKGQSRSILMTKIRELLPAKVLLPENRLETLLHQAQSHQFKVCKFHNTLHKNSSLLEDHHCNEDTVPSQTTSILEKHDNEVWYVRFSNSGQFLASTGKDTSIIIWDMKLEKPQPIKTLAGHKGPISFLSWSHDDKMILTCGNDNMVKLWDTDKGELLRVFSKHSESVMACAWFSDNQRFVTGGLDKIVCIMDISGKEIKTITSARVNDLALTSDDKTLIVICQEKKIHFIDMEDYTEETIQASDATTSLELSSDNKYLLVNTSASEIHLYDVKNRLLKQKFTGHKQSRYVIRSCFVGAKNLFIVSGSEDSQVYVWHRRRGVLLYSLEGHAGTVNTVTASPHNIFSFVSCSDDKTIRVWQSPIAIETVKDDMKLEETTNVNGK